MQRSILIDSNEQVIRMKGSCVGFQTELDYAYKNGILVPVDTGIKVPGTKWESDNTVETDLTYYMAYNVGAHTTNQALDNLFASNGTKASVGAANDGKDGIIEYDSATPATVHIFTTTKNAGGTNAEGYIEFYGYIDGSITLDEKLYLVFAYNDAGDGTYSKLFASISISQVVAANRRYHHYWKLTFSIV